MKKLLLFLLLSITVIQLSWAAVGSYRETPATVVQHSQHLQHAHDDHHTVGMQTAAKHGANDSTGYCSSCEMQAASLAFVSQTRHAATIHDGAAPAGLTAFFTSHIPDHPEEPDWLALPSHGAAIRL